MLIIYTGDGKGKTSACVGQAVRALGAGLRVAFAQFMKRDTGAGEQQLLRQLLGHAFYIGGAGFYYEAAQRPEHRAAVENVLGWALERVAIGETDMLVLDEALYALRSNLLEEDELRGLIQSCRTGSTHLVLSGRGLPDWLRDEADLVTDMHVVKHPYEQGIPAQQGIEF